MSDHGYSPIVKRMGIPDEFIEHGTVAELQHICHIDQNSIIAAIKETKK
jgi:1-deoxy-D-xylulose-5-phosphate synthase